MQVTTSGVIPNQFLKSDFIELFLKNERIKFEKMLEKNKVLYEDKNFVDDTSLNYLNIKPDNLGEECLKNMILFEYNDCERMYPYLGDYFINKFFKSHQSISQSFFYQKKKENHFIKTLKSKHNKNIAKLFFNNISLNRSINVECYNGDQVVAEFSNDFVFNIDFDYDYFTSINNPIKNYNYIIINGIIETVGEIHHLLQKANETKEPYVIFCFGVSEEIKQVIIKKYFSV